MDAQSITLSLEDLSGGFEASPDRVRLGDLAHFTEEVQTFLRGSAKEIDTQTLEVAIRRGSLSIQTTPIAMAPGLFADLRALVASRSLEGIDPKRREVMQRWQKGASQTGASIRISAPMLPSPIVIDPASDFHADDADHWVVVERLMAMLRIKAEFNVLTRELRNARLLEFVEYDARVDEEGLQRLISRGDEAWKDVPDATTWVDELRGDGH